jgi:hypothetical protein
MAFIAFGLAILLSAISTPLYRVLEGYLLWPARWREARIQKQRKRRQNTQERADAAPEGWQQALIYEELHRFPVSDVEIVATRFGNALRASETYAADRYSLDSQDFWSELYASIPETLRTEYEQARAAIDFFVNLFYLAGAFGTLTLIIAFGTPTFSLLPAGFVAFALMPLSYRLATASTSYFNDTVRAIVNVGRIGLAANLGLRMPASLGLEREMWETIHAFTFYPYDEKWANRLNKFRAENPKP